MGKAPAMPRSENKGRARWVRPFVVPVVLAVLAPVAAAAQRPLPAEITRFLDRRMNCEHWMGEEPYDAERRAEIEDAINDLRCARLGQDERRLRRIYARRPDVIAKLDEEVVL
jgi:hypothetical protein